MVTSQEIKKVAWDFLKKGEKQDFSKEWGKTVAKYISTLNLKQASLLADLIDIFYAYRQGRYDFQTTDNKCKEYIKKFEEGSVNEY